MVLERLVVVDGRLYRNRIVEEVGIANLYTRHDVVELLACMHILAVYAKIYAVLLNVVATTDTNRELICNFLFARVIIVELSEKQKVVGNAFLYALETIGVSIPANTPMIAITIINSTKVKAFLFFIR